MPTSKFNPYIKNLRVRPSTHSRMKATAARIDVRLDVLADYICEQYVMTVSMEQLLSLKERGLLNPVTATEAEIEQAQTLAPQTHRDE